MPRKLDEEGWKRRRYFEQKNAAKERGKEWRLTFEEWCSWWEDHLGPDWMNMRGCTQGKYVMARLGDKGPYSLDNIKCVSQADNHTEYYKPHRR